MIKQIYRTDAELSDSYYGYKIRSYLNAYGTEYDFCRIFANEAGGTVLVYNSTMIADGSFDTDELEGFIEMLHPISVEVPGSVSLDLQEEYCLNERTLFKAPRDIQCEEISYVKQNAFLTDSFSILSEAFGITEFDEWYVDISHRIRHGVSDIFLYKTTTVTKAFEIEEFVFLSHIATAKADRGQGTAGKLLKWLCKKYQTNCKDAYLYSKPERYTFYQSLGFERVLTDTVYEKKTLI